MVNKIGKMKTEVTFRDVSKELEFRTAPSSGQDLYQGVHFRSTFDLLPPSMQVSGNHILSNIQRNTLSKVVAKFPKFPVSPAVEKLIYAEVDRMS